MVPNNTTAVAIGVKSQKVNDGEEEGKDGGTPNCDQQKVEHCHVDEVESEWTWRIQTNFQLVRSSCLCWSLGQLYPS